MKKIITTVGTSFITNYEKENSKLDYEYIFQKYKHSHDKSNEKIIQKIVKWAGKKIDASAEISSLLKISQEIKETIDVYLICSDTIASAICAELILKYFDGNKEIHVKYNKKIQLIEHLQINDRKEFLFEGMPNLITIINKIADEYFENVIFNITGGYKGIIPYMTMMASVNSCEIKYIFEDSQELITIPSLPIKIDYEIFDRYYQQIKLLEDGIENYSQIKNNEYLIYEELEKKGLVEKAENYAFISPIGLIFLKKYQNRFVHFYCIDSVWEEIQKQKDILRILKEKFFTEIRESKTENKQEHFVFDDGNNNNRIYYIVHNALIYIYKTFENEEEAKNYIQTSVNYNEIIKKSKIRKIKK